MKQYLDKLGSYGAVFAAIACPICFPKLALLGAVIGLGGLAKFEGFFIILLQVLLIASLVGHYMAYKRHKNKALLISVFTLVIGFFIAFYVVGSEWLLYIIFVGLIASSIWLVFENKRCSSCQTNS